MAYFRKLKLDPNFEDWLDSRILKLKAEGVIVSDDEEDINEKENLDGTADRWSTEPDLDIDPEVEFVWGEEPSYHGLSEPVENSEYPREITEDLNEMDKNKGGASWTETDASVLKHISTEVGGDYYQFVWESEEEAEIFDREEYQLGHGYDGQIPPSSAYSHIEPEVHVTNDIGENIRDGVYQNGDISQVREPPRSLGGLVLGIGRRDVEVAYTKVQGGQRTNNNTTPQWDQDMSPDWDLEFRDEKLPDPRFSITEQDDSEWKDRGSNEVQMLAMPPTGSRTRHNRSSRVRDAESRKTASQGGDSTETPADDQLRDTTIEGATYRKDRIFLPMDGMEMTMTDDDLDDDDMIDEDDFDVRSELAPDTANIVTVDQATLAQQWRSKSQRTKTLIIVGIVVGVLIVFSVVTFLIVHILTTSW